MLYILVRSTDSKIIGHASPQVTDDGPFADYSPFLRKLPEGDLYIPPRFKLNGKAKLVDWLSSVRCNAPLHVLISDFFADCLGSFKAPLYRCFPTTVVTRNAKEYDYVIMMHAAWDGAIDFERSEYVRMKANYIPGNPYPEYDDLGKVNISSFEELDYLMHNQERRVSIYNTALFLKEDVPYDFYIKPGHPWAWIVNEKVKDGLLAAKIKGLFFIPFQQGMNMKETDLYDLARVLEGTIGR